MIGSIHSIFNRKFSIAGAGDKEIVPPTLLLPQKGQKTQSSG